MCKCCPQNTRKSGTEPTERSIPPVIRISVMPMARIPLMET